MDALQDVSDELWDRTIGINLSGVFYVMRSTFAASRRFDGGSLIAPPFPPDPGAFP